MAAISETQNRGPGGVRHSVLQSGLGGISPLPRTPGNATTSAFSSPSHSSKIEEDPLILEFGTRVLRAGPARDMLPLCSIWYGPAHQSRAGEYRYWEPDFASRPQKRKSNQKWTKPYELWPLDLRGVNLGLVEDKVELYVRQAYSKYLMSDPRLRRILLVLPPAFPRALLAILLYALFGIFQCPSASLFSAPVLNAVAAGLRSSLVVDIGWNEATVTAVYDYREAHTCRSIRAGKKLVLDMRRFLTKLVRKALSETRGEEARQRGDASPCMEEVEDVLMRMAWCRRRSGSGLHDSTENRRRAENDGYPYEAERDEKDDPVTAVYLKSLSPPLKLELPFSSFSDVVERALFSSKGVGEGPPDDEELPIGHLAYKVLMSIPFDVRSVCMSRIVVVGGPSGIPGIKRRVVDEVAHLSARASSGTPSKRNDKAKRGDSSRDSSESTDSTDARRDVRSRQGEQAPAAFADQETDEITESFRRMEAKDNKPTIHGVARGIESLGAWSGASLVAALKIKPVVEVEREKFLQHGLAGANLDGKAGVAPSRSTAPTAKTGPGDRSSWTLGVWT